MTGGTPLSVGLNKNDFIQTMADMWVPLVNDTVLDNVFVNSNLIIKPISQNQLYD